MKHIILFFISVLMPLSLLADNAGDARKLLDKTAALVTKKGGAQASFTISGGSIAKQSGTIAIKGGKFCASTPSATIWYDGKTQWTYLKANDEVNIATPKAANQQMMNPYTFLNLYKKGYNLSVQTQGKKKVVHMVAQGKANIKEVYITLDANGTPSQVRLNQGGKWTTIVISNFKQKSLPDSAFVFNSKDYPHAEVIDLR